MFFIFQYFVHVHELRNSGVILRFAFFTNDFVHVHGNKNVHCGAALQAEICLPRERVRVIMELCQNPTQKTLERQER